MLNIYICENNKNFRNYLVTTIKNDIFIENRDMTIIKETADPTEIISFLIKNKKNNIYFLNVSLKTEIDGIELARKIRQIDPMGYIIFITKNTEKYLLTFEYKVQALEYIIKSTQKEITYKIKNCLEYIDKQVQATDDENFQIFSFKNSDIIGHIPLNEILMFRISDSRNKKICLHTETAVYEFRDTLKNISHKMETKKCNPFFRVSEATYVNTNKINIVDSKQKIIKLYNGSEFEVSRRRLKDLLNNSGILKRQEIDN